MARPFLTIQYAIDNMGSGGDVIHVAAGTYAENLFIGSGVNNLTIIGDFGAADSSNVILDPAANQGIRIAWGASGVLIEAMTIQDATDGISLEATGSAATNITLRNLILKNCSDDGIAMDGAGVDNNTIENCFFTGNNVGIKLADADNNTIKNCVATANTTAGIYLWGNGTVVNNGNTFQNNIIHNETLDGIYQLYGNNTLFNGNRVYSNTRHGFWLQNGSGNLVTHNLISTNGQHGVLLTNEDNIQFIQNDFLNNGTSGSYEGLNMDDESLVDTAVCNNFVGSSQYAIYSWFNATKSSPVVDARSNYYGTTDSGAIRADLINLGGSGNSPTDSWVPFRLDWVDTTANADTVAPAPPTGVTVTRIYDSGLVVSWTAPTEEENGNPVAGLTGYRVYRTTNGQLINTGDLHAQLILDTTTATTAILDSGLARGTAYYYYITAYDNAETANESWFSSPGCGAVYDSSHWYVDAAFGRDGYEGSDTYPFATVARALMTAGSGETIHVAAGVYGGTVTITAESDVITIIGDFDTNGVAADSSNVIFHVGDSTTNHYFYDAFRISGADSLLIQDVTIRHARRGLDVNNCDSLTLRNVRLLFHNQAAALFYNNCTNVLVTNCVAGTTTASGIKFENSAGTVVNSLIIGNGSSGTGHGLEIATNAVAFVENCVVKDNGQDGINVSAGSILRYVLSTTLSGNGRDGINVNASAIERLRQCSITGSGNNGIALTDLNGVFIEHNEIRNSGSLSLYYDNADSVYVLSNEFSDAGTHHIYMTGGAGPDTFAANNFDVPSGSYFIADQGGGNVITAEGNYYGTSDMPAIAAKVTGGGVAGMDTIPFRFIWVDTGVGADTIAPSSPTALTASAYNDSSCTVAWTAPTTNENGTLLGDLQGYRVYRTTDPVLLSTGDLQTAKILDYPASVTLFIDTGLTTGDTYYYYVTAYDSNDTPNESWYSESAVCNMGVDQDSTQFSTTNATADGVDSSHVQVVILTDIGVPVADVLLRVASDSGIGEDSVSIASADAWPFADTSTNYAFGRTNAAGIAEFYVIKSIDTTPSVLRLEIDGGTAAVTATIYWHDPSDSGYSPPGFGESVVLTNGVLYNARTNDRLFLNPIWSPDGNNLAVIGKTGDDTWNIYVSSGGGALTKVTGSHHQVIPTSNIAWGDVLDGSGDTGSGDGNYDIVFAGRSSASGHVNIFAVRADGSDAAAPQEGCRLQPWGPSPFDWQNRNWYNPTFVPGSSDTMVISVNGELMICNPYDIPRTLVRITHLRFPVNADDRRYLWQPMYADQNTLLVTGIVTAVAGSEWKKSEILMLKDIDAHSYYLAYTDINNHNEVIRVNNADISVFRSSPTLSYDKKVVVFNEETAGGFNWMEFLLTPTNPNLSMSDTYVQLFDGTNFDVKGAYYDAANDTFPNNNVNILYNSSANNYIGVAFRADTVQGQITTVMQDASDEIIQLVSYDIEGVANVDQNGGILIENGRVTVVVDEGDLLSGNVAIRVVEPSNPAATTYEDSIALSGAARDFFPDGQQFDDSITVIIYYDAADLAAAGITNGTSDEYRLKVYWYDVGSASWVDYGGVVNPTDRNGALGSITIQTSHFSEYAAGFNVHALGETEGTMSVAGPGLAFDLGGNLPLEFSARSRSNLPFATCNSLPTVKLDGVLTAAAVHQVYAGSGTVTVPVPAAGRHTLTASYGAVSGSDPLVVLGDPRDTPGLTLLGGVGTYVCPGAILVDDTRVRVIGLLDQASGPGAIHLNAAALNGNGDLPPTSFDGVTARWENLIASGLKVGETVTLSVSVDGAYAGQDTILALDLRVFTRSASSAEAEFVTNGGTVGLAIPAQTYGDPITFGLAEAVGYQTADSRAVQDGITRIASADPFVLVSSSMSGQDVSLLDRSVVLSLSIPLDVPSDRLDDARVYRLTSGRWERVLDQQVDRVGRTVSVPVDEMGTYVLGFANGSFATFGDVRGLWVEAPALGFAGVPIALDFQLQNGEGLALAYSSEAVPMRLELNGTDQNLSVPFAAGEGTQSLVFDEPGVKTIQAWVGSAMAQAEIVVLELPSENDPLGVCVGRNNQAGKITRTDTIRLAAYLPQAETAEQIALDLSDLTGETALSAVAPSSLANGVALWDPLILESDLEMGRIVELPITLTDREDQDEPGRRLARMTIYGLSEEAVERCLSVSGGTITVAVAPNTFSAPFLVAVRPNNGEAVQTATEAALNDPTSNAVFYEGVEAHNFSAEDIWGAQISTFDEPVLLRFSIPESIALSEYGNLRLYHLDEATARWGVMEQTALDTSAQTITLAADHFSTFILGGVSSQSLGASLADVVIYPNPWSAASNLSGDRMIKFDNMTADVHIKIYNALGEMVLEGQISNGASASSSPHLIPTAGNAGRIQWDLRNASGRDVASGIYVVVMSNSRGERIIRKVAVIR